jgi:hypothetical protein
MRFGELLALVRYQGLTTTTTANDVVISEFRFSVPNGNATDEFVELYNKHPCKISLNRCKS